MASQNRVFGLTLISCLMFVTANIFAQGTDTPLSEQLGEKLFRESRFSQSFFLQSFGNVNAIPITISGDPVLNEIELLEGRAPHPYRDQHMSCAACHLVDQAKNLTPFGVRTYSDFSARTDISRREDGQTKTTRHTSGIVGLFASGEGPLHWDGEFFSAEELSCAGLTGRNMGWLESESDVAKENIVRIIQNDSGVYPVDSDLTEAYSVSFAKLGMNVQKMSTHEVRHAVCKLIADYMKSLDFSRDEDGFYNGSAYDRWLKLNGLPRGPESGQTAEQYAKKLTEALFTRAGWKWPESKTLKYHRGRSKFGPEELEGFKVFLSRGHCVGCHTPPNFTDSRFHNTGISQFEYDKIHGEGTFLKLKVPNFKERNQMSDWMSTYRTAPNALNPMNADLGVWNILLNPQMSKIQSQLHARLCPTVHAPRECERLSENDWLTLGFAAMKTPTLRDLGQSAPYFSNGSARALTNVIDHYVRAGQTMRNGKLRNGDPRLMFTSLSRQDKVALVRFLRSLNEDYD